MLQGKNEIRDHAGRAVSGLAGLRARQPCPVFLAKKNPGTQVPGFFGITA
jgi:hypothetical protein